MSIFISPSAETEAHNDDPHYWFNHWTSLNPEWEAIVISESQDERVADAMVQSWSYGQLNVKADELATLVYALAEGDGPVGLCIPRTLISTAALAAIFKLDHTCLPVHEQFPAERKKHLVEDRDCALVITEENMLGVEVPCPILDVSLPFPPVSETPSSTPSVGPGLGAYMLYMSG